MQKFNSVDELVNTIRPVDPIYCIRPNSIKSACGWFKSNFPGKILYAVKTNPNERVICLPLILQFILQYWEPLGWIWRYIPPPSEILIDFFVLLTFLIACLIDNSVSLCFGLKSFYNLVKYNLRSIRLILKNMEQV